MRPNRHPRRGLPALAAAAVLAAGGGAAVAWAATHQEHAPQPAASAAGTIDAGGAPTEAVLSARAAKPRSHGPVLPRSVPVSIAIPAIGVHSRLLRLGLNGDGTLAVPQPGPDYDRAAWYRGSPTPGQLGPAVIEGHVDSAANGPSVFFRLGALRPGDRVRVARADGSTAVFRVDGVRRYPKDRFPTLAVYGNTDRPELRLITCGGSFDRSSGHYRFNVVAFAHLVAATRDHPTTRRGTGGRRSRP